MNWVDAGLVPKLKAAFNGDMRPAPKPVDNSFEALVASNPEFSASQTTALVPANISAAPTADSCHTHPQAEPEYVCRTCGEVFCKDCPKLVKGVAVCPLCGDSCRKYQTVTEQAARAEFQSSGFGMEDFLRAIRYPLEHKAALLCGALIYGFSERQALFRVSVSRRIADKGSRTAGVSNQTF